MPEVLKYLLVAPLLPPVWLAVYLAVKLARASWEYPEARRKRAERKQERLRLERDWLARREKRAAKAAAHAAWLLTPEGREATAQAKARAEEQRLLEQERRKAIRQPLDREVERRVMQEGGGKCAYCGNFHRKLEIDHIIPWSISRDDSYDNLVVACQPCNRNKGARSGPALRRWLRRVNCVHPKVMAAAGRAA